MRGERQREYDPPAAGPIGRALATWRVRRGLSQRALSERAGLETSWVSAVETGREWVDRRRPLAALASALRLDVGELTGQPYSPLNAAHADLRAVAHRVRRALAADQPGPDNATGPRRELEEFVTLAEAAEAAGDEHGLALVVPTLIEDQAADLHSRGHAMAAGLLRRLGYRDLAWLLLHRAARAGGAETGAVRAEEVRLLLELGLPEDALVRAKQAEEAPLPLLKAFAHAMAGRPGRAASLLDAVAERARNGDEHAMVAAARVAVAVEAGDFGAAADCATAAEPQRLTPAARTALLVRLAATAARTGRTDEAAGHLEQAEATAPLRFLLDPFARELLAALPARITDTEIAGRLRETAQRAGIP
ncbi:XRE family transcriptional regulator [Peterkaempfera bronchialis]|uniref:XRE family transcriptional regulator n=1 Tax=Peterkaempfera bronchialis TaxID=2126346 RepID=A0A345SXK0_9ACTN|nr:helix-turn-helix transcriptional regulator [Peterkaempfera bronchialis]AXI78455.1 XRE family transcriptional regulator [Peterkaempfera bronchialis]